MESMATSRTGGQMKLHPKLHSKKFQFFYEAFAFKTYGKSMGRAADTAAVEFKTLSKKEQRLGIEWFLELFSQKREYYGTQYFKVIAYSKDIRFLPFLEEYHKKLKAKEKIYKTELDVCEKTIEELKKYK